jgi:hypothetical protein
MLESNQRIVTAYEDPESFFVEISKLEGLPLAKGCVPTMEEQANAIDFSQFWTEQSWDRAVTAATTADVIIVSLSGNTDLPIPVQRWMENWPHYERTNHHSLVVVFGSEPSNLAKQNALISYFQHVAASHGLDFYCNQTDQQALVNQPAHFQAN